jgi:hypothetical protein
LLGFIGFAYAGISFPAAQTIDVASDALDAVAN